METDSTTDYDMLVLEIKNCLSCNKITSKVYAVEKNERLKGLKSRYPHDVTFEDLINELYYGDGYHNFDSFISWCIYPKSSRGVHY